MNLPSSPDPFQMLTSGQVPNAFYLCLSETDITALDFVTLSELTEVSTSGYKRLPIIFNVNEASDNSSLVATCDSTLNADGEEEYLDFQCGDSNVNIDINAVYVIASFDDQDYLLYAKSLSNTQFFCQPNDTVRVGQVLIYADTWISAV